MKETQKQTKISYLFLSLAAVSFITAVCLNLPLTKSDIPWLICMAIYAFSIFFIKKNVPSTDVSSDESIETEPEKEDTAITEDNLFSETSEDDLFPDMADTSVAEETDNVSYEMQAFMSSPKQIVELDLIAAAKEAMDSLTGFAEKQKIKLHLATACDSIMMKADPISIRILFRNIIDNSIKYMGRPGHMIITISLLGDDIFLILKDTGNGLSEDETEHVFELNFQGSNRVSGNGLGLTQTKMIVEAFGGTIYAKSSPGNGMAIYIQLPVSGKKEE